MKNTMTVVNKTINSVLENFDYYVDIDQGIDEQEWFEEVIEALEEGLGFKLLGSGHFSAVFKMQCGNALKIGFKKEDSGSAYAAYCRATDSKYLPTIYHIERFEHCYMVAMPCYKTYASIVENNRDSMHVELGLFTLFNTVRGVISSGERSVYNSIIEAVRAIKKFVGKDYMDVAEEYLLDNEMFVTELQGLMNATHALKEYFEGVAAFDIHDENIMLEEDTTTALGYRLIVTDPVSFASHC